MRAARRPGILPRIRNRLFGEPDPVETQLREIARRGGHIARLANAAAFVMSVLFSLGSLVGIGADAFRRSIDSFQAGNVDILATISLVVSVGLVVCMDTVMVYAASVLRNLNARRAEPHEKREHQAFMYSAAVLEATTYLYMSVLYDHPASVPAWAVIGARALAAPLFSIYLSKARAIPVGAGDILYQVEMASGAGTIRDVVTIANNPEAPLARKVALYDASALMSPRDKVRLGNLLDAVMNGETSTVSVVEAEPTALPEPPTGPGSPTAKPAGQPARRERLEVLRLAQPEPTTRRQAAVLSFEDKARRVLKSNPALGKRALAKLVGCSESTAGRLRKKILAESVEDEQYAK
jgi:hypothetical protein